MLSKLRSLWCATKPLKSPHAPDYQQTRAYDVAHRYRANPSAKAIQDAKNAGVKTDHPIIVDPQDPNTDGSLNVKGQATHGKGHPSNPSLPLDSTTDLSGKKQPQRVVIPTQPFTVDPADLESNPIPNSDKALDKKEVKDNLQKAGAKPSAYKSGDNYEP